MAKRTLLDMVQEILSDMDSDEVNSIDDTVEAEQVALILKSTYTSMMSNRDWPHLRRGIQISSFSSLSRPTHMRLQDSIKEMCFLNYDVAKAGETRRKFERIHFLEPDEFLHKTNQENSDLDTVDEIVDPSGITILIRNDRAAEYYTSFNDEDLVFDAYQKDVEDTMQESKVQAQAFVFPTWTVEDSFIPDLPEEAFPALVEEAKSRCMVRLKQVVDSKAEQEAQRQQTWLARKVRRVNGGGITYPDYGRSKRGGRGIKGYEPTFRGNR